MVLKFNTGDNSPQHRRLKVIATGGSPQPSTTALPHHYAKSGSISHSFSKTAQMLNASSNTIMTQPMFFSPMHTPQSWQIASKRREVNQWSRFYYDNEPKIAAGIDFYATFSMNKFELECPNRKILRFFEEFVKDIMLDQVFRYISHEYWLLGDVFPFSEISCPKCGGSGLDPESGEECSHPDGKFSRVVILNPDYIDVQGNVLGADPLITMVPDEELKMIVARRWPPEVFKRIPQQLIDLVSLGQPIRLSNRSISHIRHNASPYGTYGTPLMRRCFTILAYKTKLMTANWIVAERLILPIRVVKIGNAERPATDEDIADVQSQLANVANDPNLTLVTHDAFDFEFVGATGKIHNLTNEMEQIGKEILDGMMLNQAILNGEASCHDEQTLTLTDSGFKKYDEITDADKIGCLNPETNKIEYHHYSQKHVYDYDGEMIHFKNNMIDILVTPNHRMYTKKTNSIIFEMVRADQVKRKYHFKNVNNFAKNNTISNEVILDSRDEKYYHKEIQKTYYKGKVFCFTVPYGLFVTKRNNRITVQGNSYASAQVGVEVLIARLENWRITLSEWAEKHIFLPMAMMNGFIDEKKTKALGRTVYLYPSIKWNSMNLRDNSSKIQVMMAAYDKGLVSGQTILEEMDLDYDTEIQRIREEHIVANEAGLLNPQGGAGGGMGGGMSGFGMGGGGMGGPPGGDMGGGMPGGDMGGMPGGMPGGDMGGGGMGGAPGGGGATAGGNLPFINKRGKGNDKEQQMMAPQVKTVKLTSIERKIKDVLANLKVPYKPYVQYQVRVPGEPRPFLLDFAYPELGVGLESDGSIFHDSEELQRRDKERDQKLANVGWRILRFKEDAINDNIDMVQDIIYENILEAAQDLKKRHKKSAESEEIMIKSASSEFFFEDIPQEKMNITYDIMPNDLGEILYFEFQE